MVKTLWWRQNPLGDGAAIGETDGRNGLNGSPREVMSNGFSACGPSRNGRGGIDGPLSTEEMPRGKKWRAGVGSVHTCVTGAPNSDAYPREKREGADSSHPYPPFAHPRAVLPPFCCQDTNIGLLSAHPPPPVTGAAVGGCVSRPPVLKGTLSDLTLVAAHVTLLPLPTAPRPHPSAHHCYGIFRPCWCPEYVYQPPRVCAIEWRCRDS